MKPQMLSGLVAIPDQKLSMGRVVYMHGTTAIRQNVPSRVGPNSSASPETWQAVLAFACAGYILIAPDYLGLGDSPGVHPFALGRVNATSAIDLIRATEELTAKLAVQSTNRLFITGYSEGGGLALWLCRVLQDLNDPTMTITRAAPISGPYDLSGAQADAMLAQQSSIVDIALREFFVAYFAYSTEQNFNSVQLEDCLVPSYASYVPLAFRRAQTDQDLVTLLGLKGLQLGALKSVRKVLSAPFLLDLQSKNRSNPLIEELFKNDNLDWSPKFPLYLLGLKGDNVVVFKNPLNAVSTMRKRGVNSTTLNFHAASGSRLNHLSAPAPLLAIVRKFFDRGFVGVDCDPDPPIKR